MISRARPPDPAVVPERERERERERDKKKKRGEKSLLWVSVQGPQIVEKYWVMKIYFNREIIIKLNIKKKNNKGD